MAAGDVFAVDACTDVHYVDTGMYGTSEYGAVYIVDADRPALVDTGIGTHYDRVLEALDAIGVAPADLGAIAVTHVHLDHAGGAGFLAEACPNADVYVHEVGAPHLVDPSRLVEGTRRAVGDQWQFYTDPAPVPEERVVELADGDRIDLGDRSLTAHRAPGHAPHQVVFHDDADDAVFAADAAGIWIPSREEIHETSPPPDFDLEGCLADVKMLRELDPEVLLYTHFGSGPEDVQEVLLRYEGVLTDWVRAVESALADVDDEERVVERFVEATDTEDVWGERKARAEAEMNVRGVLHYLKRESDQ